MPEKTSQMPKNTMRMKNNKIRYDQDQRTDNFASVVHTKEGFKIDLTFGPLALEKEEDERGLGESVCHLDNCEVIFHYWAKRNRKWKVSWIDGEGVALYRENYERSDKGISHAHREVRIVDGKRRKEGTGCEHRAGRKRNHKRGWTWLCLSIVGKRHRPPKKGNQKKKLENDSRIKSFSFKPMLRQGEALCLPSVLDFLSPGSTCCRQDDDVDGASSLCCWNHGYTTLLFSSAARTCSLCLHYQKRSKWHLWFHQLQVCPGFGMRPCSGRSESHCRLKLWAEVVIRRFLSHNILFLACKWREESV